MVKQHLKNIATPRTWEIGRKETIFTTRPNPGSHSLDMGMSINHFMKKDLKLSMTTKETKSILNAGKCLVNGKAITDVHYMVGFMDVISYPDLKKYYRVILNKKGKLTLIEIDDKESSLVLSKVIGKTKLKKGKIQINTLDGRNILVDKDSYKTSDSVVIKVPGQKVEKNIEFKEGSFVMLMGGKHIGVTGNIESIKDNSIIFKTKDNVSFETLKKYVFVLGNGKAELKIE
ncbi:30S ribosomal protein S4e [Candidatus Woesearchaeota archaeon]|nr:30S ribosomal protein S4e [Candidatus Woesearchaeota archaeon]